MLKINHFIKGTTLMLRLFVNGKVLTDYSTSINIAIHQYNKSTKRFVDASVNARLARIEADLNDRFIALSRSRPSIDDPSDLKEVALLLKESMRKDYKTASFISNDSVPVSVLTGKEIMVSSILKYHSDRVSNGYVMNKRTGRALADDSVDGIIKRCNRLTAVMAEASIDLDVSKFNISTIGIMGRSVVYDVWESFAAKLKSSMIGKYSDGTISKDMSDLKRIVKTFCSKHDILLSEDLLECFHYRGKERDVEVLNTAQIRFIKENYDKMRSDFIKRRKMADAVDYLYVGIMINARHGDMNAWTTANLYTDGDGQMWLKYIPKKTSSTSGVVVTVPISGKLVEIFMRNAKKYNGKLMPPSYNYLAKQIRRVAKYYPVFHNEVQVLRKGKYVIKKQYEVMYTHQLRATGTSDKLMSMPESVVRELTGHTHSSKSFARYVKVSEEAKKELLNNYFS